MDQDKTMAKGQEPELFKHLDTETSRQRQLLGILGAVVFGIAVAMAGFHIYTAGFGILRAMVQRAVHLSFAFALVFMLFPGTARASKKLVPFYDYILAALGVAAGMYIFFMYDELVLRAAAPTAMDLVVGVAGLLLVLEATRRSIGKELSILAVIFLIYAYFGPHMPGLLAHRGYSFERIISHIYFTTEGIFGTPLGVSATFVFLFILFGAFLEKTGVGQYFINTSFALTGHMRGGPAKAAVVASGFMGSISGSSVANTVTTGSLTIPLMKRVGYQPHFAGAVEAAASTGGQILPPVMGAAAFIMAEFTGIPYVQIIGAALIPALLYFVSVMIMVHLEAAKLGLKGLPRKELPGLFYVLNRLYLLAPVVAIIWYLIQGVTPLRAALYGIIWTVIIGAVDLVVQRWRQGKSEVGPLTYLWNMVQAMSAGSRAAVAVAMACATAGIIVGVVTLTGLGLKIASIIVALAGEQLLPTLALTMLASILLGLGMPTTAKYIILSTIAAPALTHLGVPLMAAHLFILYFGVIADVTPPVALAAYAGSGIAGANAMRTGVTALKLAVAGFLLPFAFAISPDLLLIDTTVFKAVLAVASALIGIVSLGAGVQNYLLTRCNIIERLLLLAAAVVLVQPGLYTDGFGILVLGGTIAFQSLRLRRGVRENASNVMGEAATVPENPGSPDDAPALDDGGQAPEGEG